MDNDNPLAFCKGCMYAIPLAVLIWIVMCIAVLLPIMASRYMICQYWDYSRNDWQGGWKNVVCKLYPHERQPKDTPVLKYTPTEIIYTPFPTDTLFNPWATPTHTLEPYPGITETLQPYPRIQP